MVYKIGFLIMLNLNYEIAGEFLGQLNLKNFSITKIAGDASFRSYYRINHDEGTHILMYAPIGFEDCGSFILIDEILINLDLSAPKIIAKDLALGLILLEDFGNESFTKYLQKNPSEELRIYQNACDVLIDLHQKTANLHFENIHKYNIAVLYREVELLIDWYLPHKNLKITSEQKEFYKKTWFDIFDKLAKTSQILVLRDYHADNLMVLNSSRGKSAVGLLDFQDGLIGSRAYDLVSLIEDARRDIDQENAKKIFDYFILNSKNNIEEIILDYEILSLQRNIKILGIFARLANRDKKTNYLNYIPRVENYVINRLNSSKIFPQNFCQLLINFL